MVKPEKIITMPNYINIKPQISRDEELNDNAEGGAIQSKRKIILSTSRFVPWKNLEAQVFVAKKLKELAQAPFFLYLVGGGNAEILRRVSRLIKENNLMNEVKILSQVSPLEIGKIFEQADVYLSTSLYEPFGVVFVEAMAAGLPIIALGTCSVLEIIKDGHVGFVVKRGPNYIDYLAERLKVVIENEDIYEYFARNSLKEAEKYDLKSNVGKFIDLYKKMIHV
jgi:glycosyltransferase involved in cell wall biosynthesis